MGEVPQQVIVRISACRGTGPDGQVSERIRREQVTAAIYAEAQAGVAGRAYADELIRRGFVSRGLPGS